MMAYTSNDYADGCGDLISFNNYQMTNQLNLVPVGGDMNKEHYMSQLVNSRTPYSSSQDTYDLFALESLPKIATDPSIQIISSSSGSYQNVSTAATLGAYNDEKSSSAYSYVNSHYLSDTEIAILKSAIPININETEEISLDGITGIWANKKEVTDWRGVLPITHYSINRDSNPQIITKKTQELLTYVQELAIRYLKPPTPPPPGEIIITKEISTLTPPAPPIIIRQQPARPTTPEPLVIREAPPKPPQQQGRKVITISGKRLPPPPRKVIIERLAPLPPKPQSVIIERWLPYTQAKRRVIYQRNAEKDPVIMKPRNIIVQWEAPQVIIQKDYKYLGIIRANPVEYVQRYGSTLKTSRELPNFVLDIKPPEGIILAADYTYNQVHELEGDLDALKYVNLEEEGLAEYKHQIDRINRARYSFNFDSSSSLTKKISHTYLSSMSAKSSSESLQPHGNNMLVPRNNLKLPGVVDGTYSTSSIKSYNSNILDIIGEIFSQADRTNNGRLTVSEAEKLLLKLTYRLGRKFTEDDIKRFFYTVNIQNDGFITLDEFRIAFEKIL